MGGAFFASSARAAAIFLSLSRSRVPVRVDGVFETEHHQGRYTFHNEVEATKVTSVPR